MSTETDPIPSTEGVPRGVQSERMQSRGIRTPVPARYDPLDYAPPPLVLTDEDRAALELIMPRAGQPGDPLCLCCGEPISPEGLAMLA